MIQLTPFKACMTSATADLPACVGLEEVSGGGGVDLAGPLLFSLSRLLRDEADQRPVMLAASRFWITEYGAAFGGGLEQFGLARTRLLLVESRKEIDRLWALEEALKSGAVAGAIGAAEAPSLLATRRLDLAAREGKAAAVLMLARRPGDLSAARRRWTVSPAPSADQMDDPRAPGAVRLNARLTRSHSEPPGDWALEWNDETHRFRLVAGLADHGLVPDDRAVRAA